MGKTAFKAVAGPGIFIAREHISRRGEAFRRAPDHEQVQRAITQYLSSGGQITYIEPEPGPDRSVGVAIPASGRMEVVDHEQYALGYI